MKVSTLIAILVFANALVPLRLMPRKKQGKLGASFGLRGTVFSSNIARARALASRIETGMLFINTPATSRPELPFGGIKRSGYGRELGDARLKEFVSRKLVVFSKN